MKASGLALFLIFFLIGCSSAQKSSRRPGSSFAGGPCTQSIESFFNSSVREEVSSLTESGLIEKGLLREGEIFGIINDPVYKSIVLSEDEALREESAKVVALIRRYRPELAPSKVADFYHSLFHSCKI